MAEALSESERAVEAALEARAKLADQREAAAVGAKRATVRAARARVQARVLREITRCWQRWAARRRRGFVITQRRELAVTWRLRKWCFAGWAGVASSSAADGR